MLLLVAIPLVVRYSLRSFDMKEEPRSLCTYDGKPNVQNNVVKCEMTVAGVYITARKSKGIPAELVDYKQYVLVASIQRTFKINTDCFPGAHCLLSFSLDFS